MTLTFSHLIINRTDLIFFLIYPQEIFIFEFQYFMLFSIFLNATPYMMSKHMRLLQWSTLLAKPLSIYSRVCYKICWSMYLIWLHHLNLNKWAKHYHFGISNAVDGIRYHSSNIVHNTNHNTSSPLHTSTFSSNVVINFDYKTPTKSFEKENNNFFPF